MKPSIERELEAIRKALRDLEARLKNEREQLGHREVFSVGRRGEVPAPTKEDVEQGKVLGAGSRWVTGSSGGGGAGTPDGSTLSVVTGVLNADPLSGTINARFESFAAGSGFLTGVAHDTTLTGLGTSASPLSASPLSGTINARFINLSGTIDGHFNALSGTINSAIIVMGSGSQVWTQTADGSEGTTLSAVLPVPFPSSDYHAWVTNYEGAYSPTFKIQSKTTSGFQVVSTAPYLAGDKIDLLAVSSTLGPVADGTAISNLSGTVAATIVSLSSSINSRFATLGGGYLGRGVGASTFAAGSIVKRGPFVFGTFSGSSVDPLVVEGNVGSATDWKIVGSTGIPTQSGSILILVNNTTSRDTAAFRNSTNTGIDKKRLICEAMVGPNGGADAFSFGILNASEGYSTSASGMRGMTGSLGVEIDIWNNRVSPFMTGTNGPFVSVSVSAGAPGNDILETSRYYRYYLDFNANGAGTHLTMSLYRENWDSADAAFPGYIAEWIVAKPAWISNVNTVTWRSGVGAWAGGVAGHFRIRSFFVQYGTEEWDLLSILPHTPRIDWRIF